MGFLDRSVGKESACNASLGGEDPLEKEMAPTPVFLPGEFHEQRSPEGYSPWGCKSWTQLSDKTTNLYQGTFTRDFCELCVCVCFGGYV